jgi:hypothetical protein
MATGRRFVLVLLAMLVTAGAVSCGTDGGASQAEGNGEAQRFLSATEVAQGAGPTPDNLSVMPLSSVRSLPLEGVREGDDEIRKMALPVRHDVPQAGQPILTLRYWRLKKGTFDDFYRLSTDGLWPYFEKMGARMVGCWRVTMPDIGGEAGMLDHPDYDEVYMLVRYASFEHWKATRTFAHLAGNGPDWEQARAATAARGPMVLDSWVTFLEGGLYEGGPFYTPALQEEYRLVGGGGE